MSFGTRLKEKRESLGITQPQLAEMLNVSKGAIGNWETDVNSPRATLLYDLFEILHCDANYLFQDEMNNLKQEDSATPFEMEYLVKKYRDLDPFGRETVTYILGRETARVQQLKEKAGNIVTFESHSDKIPGRIISYYYKNASAGTGQVIFDNPPEQDLEIPDIPEYRNVSYAIGVNGNSMEPLYYDSDILLVEATRELQIGDIGIFQVDGQCYVKKLGETELISLNPEAKNIPLNDSAGIMGKVIGKLEK